MEEGQVRRQSVSACDTSLITFQVEVGSEMFATPSSLVEDAPLPVPPLSGSVEPLPYDVGPVRRSRRVCQGHSSPCAPRLNRIQHLLPNKLD